MHARDRPGPGTRRSRPASLPCAAHRPRSPRSRGRSRRACQSTSAPAQKAAPSPASTTARSASGGSVASASKASCRSAISSALKALRTSGRDERDARHGAIAADNERRRSPASPAVERLGHGADRCEQRVLEPDDIGPVRHVHLDRCALRPRAGRASAVRPVALRFDQPGGVDIGLGQGARPGTAPAAMVCGPARLTRIERDRRGREDGLLRARQDARRPVPSAHRARSGRGPGRPDP